MGGGLILDSGERDPNLRQQFRSIRQRSSARRCASNRRRHRSVRISAGQPALYWARGLFRQSNEKLLERAPAIFTMKRPTDAEDSRRQHDSRCGRQHGQANPAASGEYASGRQPRRT
jgi:hypothetical protein